MRRHNAVASGANTEMLFTSSLDDRQAMQHASPSFVMRLFGTFEVWIDGERFSCDPKVGYLLAFLALLNSREVERSWLAYRLWPDSSREVGLANLRNALMDLRGAMGAQAKRLQTPTRGTLRLGLEDAEVDVLTFDTAVEDGSGSPELAISLYRGELLQGCDEEWVFQPREERHQAYRAALETLAARALEADDRGKAEQYLRLAIAADPLQENAYRELMALLADAGRYNEEFDLYRELYRRLDRELGQGPDPETDVLHGQIRADVRRLAARVRSEPVTKGPSPRDIPRLQTELIGRHREVREIKAALRRSWLVTLQGPPGIGKSSLAIRIADQEADHYTDGAYFVELAPLLAETESADDLARVAQAIAQRLAMPEKRGFPTVETLERFLRSKHLLLVLDNCEHLIHACAQLAERLLSQCAHVRILATSRQPFRVTSERRYLVGALSLPAEQGLNTSQQEPNTLLKYAAVRLFVDRAQALDVTFALTSANAPSVVRVCRSLDGIPLAIELAAARITVLSVEEIAAELDHRLQLLTRGSRTALPHQQTLRAALDWSCDRLPEPEKILLRRLSVFRGTWSLEAIRHICAREDIRAGDVLDLVQELVEKSLVATVPGERKKRFRMLETIREYAEEKLHLAGEEPTIRWRHFGWCQAIAERAQEATGEGAHGEWMDRLEAEHDNLRAALEWSARSEDAASYGLCLAIILSNFWEIRGYWAEGRDRLVSLLARAPDAPAEWRAAALTEAGSLALHEGGCQTAGRYLADGLALWREQNDQSRIREVLEAQGNVMLQQGKLDAADEYFAQCLEAARSQDDKPAEARSLHNRAQVALARHDCQETEKLLEESLVIKRECGDERSIAVTLNSLGYLYLSQNQNDAAAPLFQESLALFRCLDDRPGTAKVLGNLGNLFGEQGDFPRARRCFEEALAIDRSSNNKQGMATTLSDMGLVSVRDGNLEEAQNLLEKSLALWKELLAHGERVVPAEMTATVYNLGEVAWYRGDLKAARDYAEQSLALKRRLGHQSGIADSLRLLALIELAEGRGKRAGSLLRESLLLRQHLDDKGGIADCLKGLARVAKEQGELSRAARHLAAAESLWLGAGTARPAMPLVYDEEMTATLKVALGEEGFTAATEAGRAMTPGQAVEDALRGSDPE